MFRNIPSFENSLLFFLRKDTTEENYVEIYEEFIVKQEESIERRLNEIFRQLGINSSVKSERYSLPFNKQIKHTGYGESYLNAAFETGDFFRKIVKEIIDQDLYKVRFYIFSEIEDSFPMGKVNYYFNYYKHEPKS